MEAQSAAKNFHLIFHHFFFFTCSLSHAWWFFCASADARCWCGSPRLLLRARRNSISSSGSSSSTLTARHKWDCSIFMFHISLSLDGISCARDIHFCAKTWNAHIIPYANNLCSLYFSDGIQNVRAPSYVRIVCLLVVCSMRMVSLFARNDSW